MKKRYGVSAKTAFVGILSVFLVLVFFSSAKALVIYELFNNENIATVYNGPTQSTKFSIDTYYEITEIETYHWNSRQGKVPGQIRLVHNDGTIYGPWKATAREGYTGVPNAYWQVHPFVVIKPGTYTIQVSDNASWSHNRQSGNRGFAKVWGILSIGGSTSTDTDIIFDFVEDMDFGQPVFVPARQQTQCFDIDGNNLCYRQYRDYYGHKLYLVTYTGNFWLFLGEYSYLGTIQEWITFIDPKITPSGLEGNWKRNDGLIIEVKGDSAYFVSFSRNWQQVADAGFVYIGDKKWRNITKLSENKWSHNDLWFRSETAGYSLKWSDSKNSSITMSEDGNSLTVRSISPFDLTTSSTSNYTRQ
jgi:hypothetical protein